MTKNMLNEKLVNALSNFSRELSKEYDEQSTEPATHSDIATLSIKTHALFDDFRKAIIEYLD